MAELIVGAIISAAVSTAVGYVVKALTPKPKRPKSLAQDSAPASTDILGIAPNPGGPQIGVFGHRRIGGRVILHEKRNNITYIVVAIAGAPLHAINAVYINNNLAAIDGSGNVLDAPWRGFNVADVAQYSMNIATYDGSQVAADSVLVAAFPGWTADHIGELCAYVRIRINPTLTADPAFSETYQKGVPDFTFDVCGHHCYDPREVTHDIDDPTTWEYSTNAAIINANYLIHELGHALPHTRVDWPSVAAAADICDEPVDLANGGQELRYTSSAFWYTDERHEAVLDRLGDAHAGGAFFVGTKYRMRTGAWTAPSASFSSDHYEGDGLSFAETAPIDGLVNGVRGAFTSPLHNYEERDFPSYQDAAALADDGQAYWLDLNLQCVTSASQAQRLARIAYNKARHGFAARVLLNFSAFDVVADDVIELTDTLADFAAKTFRVSRDELSGEFECDLTLEHEREDFFAWDETTDEVDFAAVDPVAGEGGNIKAPGGVLFDNQAGTAGTIQCRFEAWGNADDNIDRLRAVGKYTGAGGAATDGDSDNAYNPTGQYNLYATAGIGSAGSMTTAKVQATQTNSGAKSELVEILQSPPVTRASLDGLTTTTSPHFRLPPPRAPRIKLAFGGAAILSVKAVTGPKSDAIEFWEGTTPVFGSASLISTNANADFDTAVTGTPGQAKFYWARTKYNTGPRYSEESNPTLVVF